jgi:hypothetical protein
MPSLRLIAWNCNHGSLAERALLLQPLKPDIVFLRRVLFLHSPAA